MIQSFEKPYRKPGKTTLMIQFWAKSFGYKNILNEYMLLFWSGSSFELQPVTEKYLTEKNIRLLVTHSIRFSSFVIIGLVAKGFGVALNEIQRVTKGCEVDLNDFWDFFKRNHCILGFLTLVSVKFDH